MRRFEAYVYTDGGTQSFRVEFDATDYWEAQRRMIAMYGEGKFNYLTRLAIETPG